MGNEAADPTRADLVEEELRGLVELAALHEPDGNRSLRAKIVAIEMSERVLGVPRRSLSEEHVVRRGQDRRVDVPLGELHRVDQLVGGDPLPIIIGMAIGEQQRTAVDHRTFGKPVEEACWAEPGVVQRRVDGWPSPQDRSD